MAQEDNTIDPIEVALAAMQGLLASGVYNENPEAAAVMAWHMVPAFYDGANKFSYMMQQQQEALRQAGAQQQGG